MEETTQMVLIPCVAIILSYIVDSHSFIQSNPAS